MFLTWRLFMRFKSSRSPSNILAVGTCLDLFRIILTNRRSGQRTQYEFPTKTLTPRNHVILELFTNGKLPTKRHRIKSLFRSYRGTGTSVTVYAVTVGGIIYGYRRRCFINGGPTTIRRYRRLFRVVVFVEISG